MAATGARAATPVPRVGAQRDSTATPAAPAHRTQLVARTAAPAAMAPWAAAAARQVPDRQTQELRAPAATDHQAAQAVSAEAAVPGTTRHPRPMGRAEATPGLEARAVPAEPEVPVERDRQRALTAAAVTAAQAVVPGQPVAAPQVSQAPTGRAEPVMPPMAKTAVAAVTAAAAGPVAPRGPERVATEARDPRVADHPVAQAVSAVRAGPGTTPPPMPMAAAAVTRALAVRAAPGERAAVAAAAVAVARAAMRVRRAVAPRAATAPTAAWDPRTPPTARTAAPVAMAASVAPAVRPGRDRPDRAARVPGVTGPRVAQAVRAAKVVRVTTTSTPATVLVAATPAAAAKAARAAPAGPAAPVRRRARMARAATAERAVVPGLPVTAPVVRPEITGRVAPVMPPTARTAAPAATGLPAAREEPREPVQAVRDRRASVAMDPLVAQAVPADPVVRAITPWHSVMVLPVATRVLAVRAGPVAPGELAARDGLRGLVGRAVTEARAVMPAPRATALPVRRAPVERRARSTAPAAARVVLRGAGPPVAMAVRPVRDRSDQVLRVPAVTDLLVV